MKYANLTATKRDEHGRGASRRLRHSGMVPAIIYGSNADAMPVSLDHNTLFYALKNESFHTSILNLEVNGKTEKVLLRDYQMHAFRPQVLHIDFQRVNEKEEIQIRIPLHFLNEETSFAVKSQSAHITTVINDVEIRALAKDIPHFIEVDLQNIKIGESVHLSNLVLPEGVKLVSLLRGDDGVVATAAGIVEVAEEEVVAVSAADIPTVAGDKKEDKKDGA
ncbi:MAG: ribosomal protein [Burkholderiales bacterium]|jgi:large subunit ribosomal protein L25|nr:ribosomal protein [Burkholderiales bacterium]